MKINQPPHILHYAEQGVHQCWNCKNRVGEIIYPLIVSDNGSVEQLIDFLLPGCKVADQYMLYTTFIPCDKYEAPDDAGDMTMIDYDNEHGLSPRIPEPEDSYDLEPLVKAGNDGGLVVDNFRAMISALPWKEIMIMIDLDDGSTVRLCQTRDAE